MSKFIEVISHHGSLRVTHHINVDAITQVEAHNETRTTVGLASGESVTAEISIQKVMEKIWNA